MLGVLDTVKRVAGVGGDEPCDVLRLAQGDGLGERPLEVFSERAANMFRRFFRRRDHVPEFLGVSGEAEAFEFGLVAVRSLANDEKIVDIGDDDEPVGAEIFADLGRVGCEPGVVASALDLDDAPLRHLPAPGLTSLDLIRGE
jgi:hypothetical protein